MKNLFVSYYYRDDKGVAVGNISIDYLGKIADGEDVRTLE